jgi:prepilin-type processing-associated H-X9-DG protein
MSGKAQPREAGGPDGTQGVAYGPFSAWGVFSGDCGKPSSWWGSVTACDYGSFGMNAWVCNPPADQAEFESHNVARYNWRTFTIKGAGRVPLLGDEGWIDCWPLVTDDPPAYDGEPYGQYSGSMHMVRICINRHNGYVNWLFMDYSVRPVGLKELWHLPWHKRYDFDLVPTSAYLNSQAPWMKQFKSYD